MCVFLIDLRCANNLVSSHICSKSSICTVWAIWGYLELRPTDWSKIPPCKKQMPQKSDLNPGTEHGHVHGLLGSSLVLSPLLTQPGHLLSSPDPHWDGLLHLFPYQARTHRAEVLAKTATTKDCRTPP